MFMLQVYVFTSQQYFLLVDKVNIKSKLKLLHINAHYYSDTTRETDTVHYYVFAKLKIALFSSKTYLLTYIQLLLKSLVQLFLSEFICC